VGTLRLLLSELQKAAKEGSSDELAVLRRERKRRAEAERAFRDGGREDLAAASRARRADRRLSAGLSSTTAQLREIVARAVAQSGASGPQELGKVMPIAMAEVAGRADGGGSPSRCAKRSARREKPARAAERSRGRAGRQP
jgi:uncharacterized protein YqeY